MSRWRATVSRPGREGADPVVLPLNGGSFSWCVNDTGTANVEVATRDLRDAGLLPARANLAGRWLSWDHPSLGAWGGVVTAVRSRDDGATELVAKAWDVLLAARRTPKTADAGMANPGDVFRRAVEDRYRASDPVYVDVAVDGYGGSVPSRQRGGSLRDLLRSLADTVGWEWRVDHAGRSVEFRRRVGRDRSATVVLSEGAAVVGWGLDFDLEAVSNELLAVPADAAYARSRSVVVRDEASIGVHGLRQASDVFPGLVTRAGLRTVAEARLAVLAGLGDTAQLTVRDEAGVWEGFDVGDTLTVSIPSAQARFLARPMVRHYDLETDLVTLSMDVGESLWPV